MSEVPLQPSHTSVKQVLTELADENLDEARSSLRLAVLEIEKPDGGESEVIDGHLLDARWALGERRGVLNALHDLAEEGLLR